MKKTEVFLWALFSVLIILHAPIHFSGIFILFVGFLLANFYLLSSTFLLNGVKGRMIFKKAAYANIPEARIVKSILIGFTYSLATIAILFMALSWPGSMVMLILALIPLLILILIAYRKNKRSPAGFYKNIQKRNFLFTILCTILLLVFLLPIPIRTKLFPLKEMEVERHK